MVRLKVLKIVFNGELLPHEIPAFRGAVAQKAGFEHQLFHNHNGNKLRYAYPLIQYKTFFGKPGIICLGDGVDEIHHFFEKRSWAIELSERRLDMKVERLDLNQFNLNTWDKRFPYYIHNWVGLNQENHNKWHKLEGEDEKRKFLEAKLIGNILSFAKGVDWHVEDRIQLEITSPIRIRLMKAKGVKVHGFRFDFSTNVFLPNHIGLGKHVSLGFGVVRRRRKHQYNGTNKEEKTQSEPAAGDELIQHRHK